MLLEGWDEEAGELNTEVLLEAGEDGAWTVEVAVLDTGREEVVLAAEVLADSMLETGN